MPEKEDLALQRFPEPMMTLAEVEAMTKTAIRDEDVGVQVMPPDNSITSDMRSNQQLISELAKKWTIIDRRSRMRMS